MRVVVAYDHRGQKSAECVKAAVQQQGHSYIDLGAKNEGIVDCSGIAYGGCLVLAPERINCAPVCVGQA